MDNKIIFDFLEKNLNLSGIKPEDTLKECLIASEAKKKNITIQEELQYQEKEYIKDTIFYPINLNFIN